MRCPGIQGSHRLLLAAALTLAPRPARADGPARLDLSWRAPDECPSASDVRARVEEYAGEPDTSHKPVKADASITRLPDGRYQLALRIEGADLDAERSLTAGGCDATTQAAALFIALALDPSLAARRIRADRPEPETRPGASPTPTPPSAAPAVAKPEPTPLGHHDTVPVAEPRLSVTLGAVADLGALPDLGGGIAGEIELALARLRLSIGGAFLPEAGRSVPQLPGNLVDVGLAAAIARACVPWRTGRFELGPCLSAEAGSLRGHIHGIALPHSGAALWLALDAGARARFELGEGWAITADAGLSVPHARRAFVVATDGGTLTVHTVAPVTFRSGLGLTYEFR
ncbi:MAG: hypothetical protein ACHQ53_09010 [Polyangiales bacterium]